MEEIKLALFVRKSMEEDELDDNITKLGGRIISKEDVWLFNPFGINYTVQVEGNVLEFKEKLPTEDKYGLTAVIFNHMKSHYDREMGHVWDIVKD